MADATTLKIALAQLNPVLGDITGNVGKLTRAREEAASQGADLVLYPELFVTGYPPEDLVRKPAFAAASRAAVEELAGKLGPGPAVLVGGVWPEEGKVYNAVALLDEGRIAAVRFKVDLPNYGVFDGRMLRFDRLDADFLPAIRRADGNALSRIQQPAGAVVKVDCDQDGAALETLVLEFCLQIVAEPRHHADRWTRDRRGSAVQINL